MDDYKLIYFYISPKEIALDVKFHYHVIISQRTSDVSPIAHHR